MGNQSQFVVIVGGKPMAGVVGTIQATGEVREATTGRVVRIPQVGAAHVAQGPIALQASEGETERPARKNARPLEELGFYRKYTEALLRRYVQLTMEAGRVSSLMGRDVIRGKASHYRINGFDDAVIFRLDMEKCLRQLRSTHMEILRRIAIQEYTHVEAAELMGWSLRTVGTQYVLAVDRLTEILLRARILEPHKVCQVPGRRRNAVSCSK